MQKAKSAHRSRMISSRIVATACGAVLLILNSALGAQVSNKVITWGENTPEWNRILHLGAVRIGCSDPPSSCLSYAQQISHSQGVDKVFVAILLKPAQTVEYAHEFSQLSRDHPVLYEVGFDDFVGQCERQKLSMPALSALLGGIAHELKGANPNLHLGITVYQDDSLPRDLLSAGWTRNFARVSTSCTSILITAKNRKVSRLPCSKPDRFFPPQKSSLESIPMTGGTTFRARAENPLPAPTSRSLASSPNLSRNDSRCSELPMWSGLSSIPAASARKLNGSNGSSLADATRTACRNASTIPRPCMKSFGRR